ncbi:hypothetical protein DE146DRAFT_145654 [Phaeosphaeria sp. MPI-PUGE-AT-0046c]|nr:hypothetical protein DE146DRAFT_145654 [Phaeosphaeria sp. MPI-PUGE-AT-0046c]
MPSMKFPKFHAPTDETICDFINEFTTELEHVDSDCPICLESFANDAATRRQSRPVSTRCSHVFHDTCLATWNAQASSCPYCRQELYLVRFYGVPFPKPIWITEEIFEQWRATEGGQEEVEGFLVTEMGRWSLPALPVLQGIEDVVVGQELMAASSERGIASW